MASDVADVIVVGAGNAAFCAALAAREQGASSIRTEAPCSRAASAGQNAALPAPTTITSATSLAISTLVRQVLRRMHSKMERHATSDGAGMTAPQYMRVTNQ